MRKLHLQASWRGQVICHVIQNIPKTWLFILFTCWLIPHVSAQQLKAVLFNPPNDPNYEYIEIKHTASTQLTNTWFLYIDGDNTQGANPGVIQLALNLASYTTGSNGLLLLHSGTEDILPTPPSETTVVKNVILNLDNGAATFLLVKNFSGSDGQDLDADNDGLLDFPRPWTSVTDAVSILDNLSETDQTYADDLNGVVLPDVAQGEADGFINIEGSYAIIDLVNGSGADPYGPFPVHRKWDENGNVITYDPLNPPLLLPGSPEFGALPIELMAFTGKRIDNTIELYWRTATEQNNHFMEVQRSKDGKTFEPLAQIPSKAEKFYSATPLDYRFTDDWPMSGVNYYRLRQVDLDGKEEFHKVIAILFKEEKSLGITVFPTLVKHQLNIALSEEADTDGKLYISDFSGRIVMQRSFERGMQQETLYVEYLQNGHYSIVIRTNRKVETARFVKQ